MKHLPLLGSWGIGWNANLLGQGHRSRRSLCTFHMLNIPRLLKKENHKRCVCLCMPARACVFTSVCMYVYVCLCICVYACVYECVCMGACLHMCIFMCVCACVCVWVHVCIYVYVYMHAPCFRTHVLRWSSHCVIYRRRLVHLWREPCALKTSRD